ncbi:MAG: four helix bundle protein [Sphingobacteriia bacterium]|jgi:four helix bundle protein
MSKNSILAEKCFSFAKSIILFHTVFIKRHTVLYDISIQLLKSGTSVGANVEEAIGAYSRKEFGSKLSIANKEIRETIYWLKLIKETVSETDQNLENLILKADEIKRILTSTLITLKRNTT